MLRSIKRAHRLDANNPDLHTCLVRFLLHTSGSPLDGPVGEVVKRQTAGIFFGPKAVQMNAEYLKKNRNSLPHLLQGARMLYVLDPSAQPKALSLVTSIEELEGVTLKNCTKVLEALRNGDFGDCNATIADYMAKCHEQFPFATAFRPPEPKANHQEKENSIKNWSRHALLQRHWIAIIVRRSNGEERKRERENPGCWMFWSALEDIKKKIIF